MTIGVVVFSVLAVAVLLAGLRWLLARRLVLGGVTVLIGVIAVLLAVGIQLSR